jgi:hypothetical protein
LKGFVVLIQRLSGQRDSPDWQYGRSSRMAEMRLTNAQCTSFSALVIECRRLGSNFIRQESVTAACSDDFTGSMKNLMRLEPFVATKSAIAPLSQATLRHREGILTPD